MGLHRLTRQSRTIPKPAASSTVLPGRAHGHDEITRDLLSKVEAVIADTVVHDSRHGIYEQLSSAKAKRLRPTIVLLCARFGSTYPEATLVRTAALVEMIHEATLFHDDIVDESRLRRGMPTAVERFGAQAAALAGSRMLYLAAELGADLPIGLRARVAATADDLCRGQLRELQHTGLIHGSKIGRARTMILKTGSLFGLAASLGSALGGADPQVSRGLERFAWRIGFCFQMVDDLDDLFGEHRGSAQRANGSDLLDGVCTLPMILALQESGSERARLVTALRNTRRWHLRETVTDTVARFADLPGLRRVFDTTEVWLKKTVETLPMGPRSATGARESLVQLAESLRTEVRTLRDCARRTSSKREG